MTEWRDIGVLTYATVAVLFLARDAYRWIRWERHWPDASGLPSVVLRSAFWPVAWIGLDWSPVRWVWRAIDDFCHHGAVPTCPLPPPVHRMPDPTPAPPPKKATLL